MVDKASAVLRAPTDAELKDTLWSYVTRSKTEGSGQAFLGSFMLMFILSLAHWECVSARICLAAQRCLKHYGTTSWGPARTFNAVCRKRWLKSWSPQDAKAASPGLRSTTSADQRCCYMMALVFFHTPLGQEFSNLLRKFNLPHGVLAVSFIFCEIRKYFGDHVSLIREAFRSCATRVRTLVARRAKLIPSWVKDTDLPIEILTDQGKNYDEKDEPKI